MIYEDSLETAIHGSSLQQIMGGFSRVGLSNPAALCSWMQRSYKEMIGVAPGHSVGVVSRNSDMFPLHCDIVIIRRHA